MKTKTTVMDTVAREVGRGVWHFSTGKLQWQWSDCIGLNLALVDGDNALLPMIYAKSLDYAAMFAHGYESGRMNT